MNIGIIIHSNTGHTLEVANEIKYKLRKEHDVVVLHVNSKNEEQSQKGHVELKDIPDIGGFDVLIFGAPIHGFALSKTMVSYLKQLETDSPKKVFIYVTHFFPMNSLGGSQGIQQMLKYLKHKNFEIINGSIIPWTFGRKKAIKKLLNLIDLEETK